MKEDLGDCKETDGIGTYQAELSEHTENFLLDAVGDARITAIDNLLRRVVSASHRVCDIGCHTGRALNGVEALEKVGVDASSLVLEHASKRGITTVHFDLDSGAALPLESDYFDVVCCFDTLEHCIRTDHVLNEINRICKQDGSFLLSIPNVTQLAAPLFWLLDLPSPCSSRYRCNHYRDFSLRLIRLVVKIHGFRIIEVEGTQIAPFDGSLSRFLGKKLPRLASTLLLCVKKEKTVVIPDGYEATTKHLFRFARNMG